ncbi:MAG: hypothetical protein OER86_12165 [Phycisphaerae bacterium]|nr:hypothetical protein [Phycisphaerae bacterium]
MARKNQGNCALCRRNGPLSFHHLIPRQVHSNKWFKSRFSREQMGAGIDICRDCHAALHKFVPDHKQMGRDYNTVKKLLGHPDLGRFIEWIRKRDTGRIRTRPPAG